MSKIVNLFFILLPCLSFAQGSELTEVLDAAQEELTDVSTEKYSYEQTLAYDTEHPWRVTIVITKTNLKNDKSTTTSSFLNLADLDPKLIKYETDKEEQLVVLKCKRRQDFIRRTNDEGDVSYSSELQVWSPEIDQATALQDLLRQAVDLANKAWKADFSPGDSLDQLTSWLKEHVIPVEIDEVQVDVKWQPSPLLHDQVELSIINTDEKETNALYSFSLADIAKNGMNLEVRKGTVRVIIGTVNRKKLIRKEEEGILIGFENSISVPVIGIEEASRLIQVVEATLPMARKLRQARMPAPVNLEEGLQLLSKLLTGAKRKHLNIKAIISPTPQAVLELTTTNTEKGSETTNRYLFDFSDLNTRNIEFRVKGIALDLMIRTVKAQDFVQKWVDGEDAGFEDRLVLPVKTIELSHQLKVLLPYLSQEASKLPIPVGDFATIEKAISDGSDDNTTQSIEQREEDCKWNYRQVSEGKKTTEDLYEYNLYDLAPKQIRYEVNNKGVFLNIMTLRKEETINFYENDEPGFTNEMTWKMKSLSAAKQVAATLKKLIEACNE